MNYTILNLILKLSAHCSPILMNPSHSFQNKFQLSNIRISRCIPSFFKSFSKNPQQINVISSSFSKFLDTTFHIETETIQYYGEKIESNHKFTNCNFKYCFFCASSIDSNANSILCFDSCFFTGENIGPDGRKNYAVIDGRPVITMIQCTFDECVGGLSLREVQLNHTIFNLCSSNYYYPLIDSYFPNFNFDNCTNCKLDRGMEFAGLNDNDLFELNHIIFHANLFSTNLFDLFGHIKFSNIILFNNNIKLLTSFSKTACKIYYTDSCLFFDNTACLTNDYYSIANQYTFQRCCINEPQEVIKNSIISENVNFIDCTFSTTECKIFNLNNITPNPERKKFNYGIIGEIEEDFVYEID